MNNDVTISVNGQNYGGFTSVSISAGIQQQCRSFQLDTTYFWPGQIQTIPVKFGDKVEIRIGGDLVITGWIDATPIRYDANSITRSVAGRSLTEDLVDCSAEVKQWRSQPTIEIVKALASTYGISVVSEVATSSQISDHSVDPGETVFESIDRLLQLSRLLSTDNERGQLVIAEPGSGGRAIDALVLGENILSASMAQDFSGLFSEYRCLGQQAGSDEIDAEHAAAVQGSQTDARVKRKRVLIIQQSGQLTPDLAKERATWESANRASKALAVDYVIQGWRQSNGNLWKPNQLVQIKDSVLGLQREMLITQINYELSPSGLLSRIRVMPKDGLEALPSAPTTGVGTATAGGFGDLFSDVSPT